MVNFDNPFITYNLSFILHLTKYMLPNFPLFIIFIKIKLDISILSYTYILSYSYLFFC